MDTSDGDSFLISNAFTAVATSELQTSRKVRQYRADLERAKESEKEIHAKLDEALSTSRSVQSTLAAVVTEKEKLKKEYNEMQAVCEDLMSEIETKAEG